MSTYATQRFLRYALFAFLAISVLWIGAPSPTAHAAPQPPTDTPSETPLKMGGTIRARVTEKDGLPVSGPILPYDVTVYQAMYDSRNGGGTLTHR